MIVTSFATLADPEQAHMEMPAPFGWPGGKSRLAKKIVSLIPAHKTYVEPFAGAASVFWAKDPSEVEILNDIDPDLMRFYQELSQLHGCDLPKTLKQAGGIKGLKASQGHQKACVFLTNVMCSFGDKRQNTARGTGEKLCLGNARMFHSRLPRFRARIKSVKLHNEDWEQTIQRYDGVNTFFYFDPPYHATAKVHTHGDDQLERLASVLPQLKGKWLLSYDNAPEVRQAFAKFDIIPVTSRYTLASGSNTIKGTQVLIANYPLKRADMEQITFADLAQIPWEVDEKTGEKFVYPEEVCGPFAWAQLHSWALNIHDHICDSCGDYAIMMAHAMHDLVNHHLGKPIQHPEDLKLVGMAMAKTLEAVAAQGQPEGDEEEPSGNSNGKGRGFKDFVTTFFKGLGTGLGVGVGAKFLLPAIAGVAGSAQCEQDRCSLSEDALNLDIGGKGEFVSERLVDPTKFDKRSFRTVVSGDHRVRIGCPKGKWSSRAEQCKVSTEGQAILHPRSEEECLVNKARGRGISIIGKSSAQELPLPTEDEVRELIDQVAQDYNMGSLGVYT